MIAVEVTGQREEEVKKAERLVRGSEEEEKEAKREMAGQARRLRRAKRARVVEVQEKEEDVVTESEQPGLMPQPSSRED